MKIVIKIVMILVAAIVLMILFMVIKNLRVPSHLGVTEGKLAPMPSSPNAVSSQTEITEMKVDPFPFKGSLEETREAIKQALASYGGIVIRTEEPLYIHAVSTTSTMKYHDDLEFFFDEKEEIVHFRSASRIGYSDMGLNRERYNSLIEFYQQK